MVILGPDFSLSADPASVTVLAGDATSSTISVAPLNGFTGTVALSVSGQPSGVSASLAPTSVTVGSSPSSTLTITTSNTTKASNYTLTITGTSGSLTHTTTVTLIVQGFSLYFTPASMDLHAGTVRAATLNVVGLNGFTGSVTLYGGVVGQGTSQDADSCPSSVNATAAPQINVHPTYGQGSAARKFLYKVTGYAGKITQTTNLTVNVAASNDPIVYLSGGDPGDPDVDQQVTCQVQASVDHLPYNSNSYSLSATWSFGITNVYYSPTVDGDFTPVSDLTPFMLTDNNPGSGSGVSSESATFTGTFAQDGYYEVEIQASVSYRDSNTGQYLGPYGPGDAFLGDTNDEPPAAPAAVTANASPAGTPAPTPHPKVKVNGPKVTFSVSLIKLGLGSKNGATQQITATVAPVASASKVTFSVTNGEATVSPGSPDASGKFTLTVTAKSATPAASPKGDAQLVAKIGGNIAGSANVLILVPKSRTSSYGALTYSNIYFGPGVRPTAPFATVAPAPDKYAWFDTTASGFVTISFYDQFGKLLDTLFDGSPVLETQTTTSSTAPTQIAVLSGGQIQDPVVVAEGTQQLTYSGDAASWNAFNLPLPDASNKNWTNTFAVHAPSVQSTTLSDSIGKVVVPPDETRTFTTSKTNDHSPGSSLVVVTHSP